ncbi:RING finger protein B [Toxocara canis]|uniref:RING finger protein B n=1 Tax=Toxocara canis TaxID=6265 RepID=A0A0B2VIS8_TOXCA|nr:RING finger protein B [Toxocara canis]
MAKPGMSPVRGGDERYDEISVGFAHCPLAPTSGTELEPLSRHLDFANLRDSVRSGHLLDECIVSEIGYPEILMKSMLDEEDMCVVCNKEKATMTFNPCRHRNSCHNCSPKLTKCPKCSEFIIYRERQLRS